MPKHYLLILSLILTSINTKEIYMSTSGNDNNDGSINSPLLTIMKCQEKASSGDIVYIRGGTYKSFTVTNQDGAYNYVFYFNKSGITYKNYNNEKVIFDFSGGDYLKDYKRCAAFFVKDGTSDITFEGFDVTNVPSLTLQNLIDSNASKRLTQSECFRISGQNISINRVNAYNNYGIGFYYYGKRATGTVYRCDAYNNVGLDSASIGNADGFGAHGNGVKFIECRAWDNSDDNFDCITSYGSNTFENCWAFRLNLAVGNIQDGNGFKIGGYNKSPTHPSPVPEHVVKNCISANNKSFGFYANHQPGKAATWTGNKAYNNKANFNMCEGNENETLDSSGRIIDAPGTREELHGNIAHKYAKGLSSAGQNGKEGNLYNSNLDSTLNSGNSWNLGITITDSDFQSLDVSQLAAPRKADGSLPDITFMELNRNGANYKKLSSL